MMGELTPADQIKLGGGLESLTSSQLGKAAGAGEKNQDVQHNGESGRSGDAWLEGEGRWSGKGGQSRAKWEGGWRGGS